MTDMQLQDVRTPDGFGVVYGPLGSPGNRPQIAFVNGAYRAVSVTTRIQKMTWAEPVSWNPELDGPPIVPDADALETTMWMTRQQIRATGEFLVALADLLDKEAAGE